MEEANAYYDGMVALRMEGEDRNTRVYDALTDGLPGRPPYGGRG